MKGKTLMKASSACRKRLAVLIVMLTAAAVMGHLGTARAETFTCKLPAFATATCKFEGSIEEGNKVTFSCYSQQGGSVEKSCSRVYSPILGETRTGLRGFYWLCEGNMTVHDSSIKDKKYMCGWLCGICEGNWQ